MVAVLVLHGPNLNLTGIREPGVYGKLGLEEINQRLVEIGQEVGLEVVSRQSNSEGTLIDILHESSGWAKGVVFNPGGYTHTSVALRDAITAIQIPVVEIHMSNILAREPFRHHSITGAACAGTISGFGWYSYGLGILALAKILDEQQGA